MGACPGFGATLKATANHGIGKVVSELDVVCVS